MRFSRLIMFVFGSVLLASTLIAGLSRRGDFSMLWMVYATRSDVPSGYSLYLYSPLTEFRRSLLHDNIIFRFQWEPNGEWFWYGAVDENDKLERLNRIHWTGCCRTTLVVDDAAEALDNFYFSLDGEWVVFLQIDLYEHIIAINQMRPDGSHHQIYPVEISPILDPSFVYEWSSDGQLLYFMTYRGETGDFVSFTGETGVDVYELDLANAHLNQIYTMTAETRSEIARIDGIHLSPDGETLTTLSWGNRGRQLQFFHHDEQGWEQTHQIEVSGYVDHWWGADGQMTILATEYREPSTVMMLRHIDSTGVVISEEMIADDFPPFLDFEWIAAKNVLDLIVVSDPMQHGYGETILSVHIPDGDVSRFIIPELCNSFPTLFSFSAAKGYRLLPLAENGMCRVVRLPVGASSVETIFTTEQIIGQRYTLSDTVDDQWAAVRLYENNDFQPSQSVLLNIQTGETVILPDDLQISSTLIDMPAKPLDLQIPAFIGLSLFLFCGIVIVLTSRVPKAESSE